MGPQAAAAALLQLLVVALTLSSTHSAPIRFAVIGDYGVQVQGTAHAADELDVSSMVNEWASPISSFGAVISVGDNNYSEGLEETIEYNVGMHYHEFIYPYKVYNHTLSHKWGAPDGVNRFYTCPGDHDWGTVELATYLDYFPGHKEESSSNPKGALPYCYSKNFEDIIEFFFMDSNEEQNRNKGMPGTDKDGPQGKWLKKALEESKASWKIVVFHHSPWSSGSKRAQSSYVRMQWEEFSNWGAHMVMTGHEHSYERLVRPEGKCEKFVFTVNGLGGGGLSGFQDKALKGSVIRFNATHGAQLMAADEDWLQVEFHGTIHLSWARHANMVDCFRLEKADNECGYTIHDCESGIQQQHAHRDRHRSSSSSGSARRSRHRRAL